MGTYQNKKVKSNYYIKKKYFTAIQKIILAVITLASITVVVSIVITFLLEPERNIKNQISSLASDYYENYLYKNITESEKITDINDVMSKYETYGFATTYLRQLLYFKNDKKTTDYLKKYCDENKTYLKIYPEPPFSKDSYRVDYSYSCDFQQ